MTAMQCEMWKMWKMWKMWNEMWNDVEWKQAALITRARAPARASSS